MKRLSKQKWLVLVLLAFLPMRQICAAPTSSEPVTDVRILIDVSGSMKKNDPHNLRASALRMLVGLMPEKADSGIWTFAKYVNMLVPYNEVNDNWRDKAFAHTKDIHSFGLFTNVEQVLTAATANIKAADSNRHSSIILLSDGLVDIPPDQASSDKSRQRILDKIIPRLKKMQVTVHTIALSDQADTKLLKAIAHGTNGWYQQVNNAKELQRTFLHLFEKSTHRDNLPLDHNHFKIDSSVKQMTILVFRKPDAKPAQLILPDKSHLDHNKTSDKLHWLTEKNYDLITLDEPMTGEWKIDADIDPDNRVMVITDLKLRTTNLPNNIVTGESFDFDASLTKKDKIITRQDFLHLVDASVSQQSTKNGTKTSSLNDHQQNGVYKTQLGEAFDPGHNDIVVTMKTATFERQRRQTVNVIAMPLDIHSEQLTDQATRVHRITITADKSLLRIDNLVVTALLTGADGSEWPYDVMHKNANEWQLTLADLKPQQNYTLSLQIRGETLKGRKIFLQPKTIPLTDSNLVAKTPIASTVPETNASKDKLLDSSTATHDKDAIKADAVGLQGFAGLSPLLSFAVGNVVILLLLGIGVLIWRYKSKMVAVPGELI